MAILVESGRIAMAIAIKAQAIHLAWGIGDPAWDTVPVLPPVDATALVDEVGRHIATVKEYVVADVAGLIVTADGRFTISSTPTNLLYFRFDFGYSDAPDVDIREVGLFTGTTTNPLLPGGTTYFAPGDIVDPGTLFLLERFASFPRSTANRQSFQLVVTI